MIKIYPTLIVKGTKLFDLWEAGGYEPLSIEAASHLITRVKQVVPPWLRIQRIQRDIPAHKISGGIKKSNLRQYVEREMIGRGNRCRCIRCREIGHYSLKTNDALDRLNIECVRHQYTASDGDELFLSLEDTTHNVLIGYLRLRDIRASHRAELSREPCMIIRELRILGREAPLGERTTEAFQHRGYGKQLIREAERICRDEYQRNSLFVLSGVGVKPYYRNLGFLDDGVYLKKTLLP